MGYYSQVGFRIEFPDAESLDKFLAQPDVRPHWEAARDWLQKSAKRIGFHDDCIKWDYYNPLPGERPVENAASRALRGIHVILEEAQDYNDGEHDVHIPSSGYFARVGEDTGDIEEYSWDGDDARLPVGYELGSVRIVIEFHR
jgi:hypothetical protein